MSKRYNRRVATAEPEPVEVRDLERENLVLRIRRRVEDLTEPWGAREWVEDRRVEVTYEALLDQLAIGGRPSTAGVSGGGPSSRPPASLEGVSLLREIADLSGRWLRVYGVAQPSGSALVRARSSLVELARRAPTFRLSHLSGLDGDVLWWWAHARVATAVDVPPWKPHVPCTVCDVWGKIQVRDNPVSAVCLACFSAWDSETIGILGRHIQLVLDAREAAGSGSDVVAQMVDRARGAGRAGPQATPSTGDLLAGVDEGRAWRAPNDTPSLVVASAHGASVG